MSSPTCGARVLLAWDALVPLVQDGRRQAGLPANWPAQDLDVLAALNYTGGTTGLPKGCEHTQRNMIYTAACATSLRPIFWGGSAAARDLDPRENMRKQAKLERNLARATPMHRSGLSDDIAHVALFLASDEASFINAHDLVVDGGRIAMFVEPPRDAST